MPQEDYKLKTEIQIAHLEQEEQTPEVQETIAELKASLQEEVEEAVAEFKEEDNKVEEIEKSVNLSDAETTISIENELQIDQNLEQLDIEAEQLKKEATLEKPHEEKEKETFTEFNRIISNCLTEYNISFDELLGFENKPTDEKVKLENYGDFQKMLKQLEHLDINEFLDSKDLNINNLSLLTNNDVRKFVVGYILEKVELPHEKLLTLTENSQDIIPPNNKDKFTNIKESFHVLNNREALPLPILEVLNKFEDCYGSKGSNLVALAITAYGTKNLEAFIAQMESIEKVLNKYNHDAIPGDAKVSMGIEYEVTESIANDYSEESALDYKKDIVLVSGSANIGKGFGGIHEIAPKPNYNPYIVMAEVKLLQDAGFLDFNFEKYKKAPRGYHLSLVGDGGLEVNENMYFLNNVMTMAQLTGITAGKEVSDTKSIFSKDFENFSNSEQKGKRCEMKGMSTDSIEQFEKAVITSHHAGIAIQIYNKYIKPISLEDQYNMEANKEIEFLSEVPDTAEVFEKQLLGRNSLLKEFESDQERDIVYEWAKLRSLTIKAIDQHNNSFVDAEFNGYILKENGEYIDTAEHIDIVRNKRLIDQNVLSSEDFKQNIPIDNSDLFKSQKTRFVNSLTNINNIFLKPPKNGDNSPVNATSVLNTMKKENYGEIMDGKAQESIFDNGGEFRDGYYYTQGASEEMIIHKSQILLNHFNKNMDKLLQTKGVPRVVEQEELIIA